MSDSVPPPAAPPPPAPGPRRGRPRSQASRRAVLDAAAALLDERGYDGFTVDEVARRSGVSKATIYAHWSGGLDIAADAYGAGVTDAVPVRSTGDAPADLHDQVRRLAAFYAGPRGRVVARLLAAGTGQPGGAGMLRERFFATRRSETVALIARGQAAGQLRADLDPELTVDLLFGAIVFRLFNGEQPLRADQAAAVADMALRAVVAPGPGHHGR